MPTRREEEYHSPRAPDWADLEIAPVGDEFNLNAQDPPRRRPRRREWVTQLAASAAAVTLLSAAVAASVGEPAGAGSAPVPTAAPSAVAESLPPGETQPPPPAETQALPEKSLAQVIEEQADWYDASRGVWLHFEGEEGWFADDSFFHRFQWRSDDEKQGTVTMSYQDIGGGYALLGSATEPGRWDMTLSREGEEYLLEVPSGLGEGNRSSSEEYVKPELTPDRFAPVTEPGVDTAGMNGVLGSTTAELLEKIAHMTVVERADVPYGGMEGAVKAAMTELWFDPGGHGSLFFDDGTVAGIEWSVSADYAPMILIRYDGVTFSDGGIYSSTSMGELTLTAQGPRLWLYNSLDQKETCFAGEPLPEPEGPDKAFPSLPNLPPNGAVEGFGVLNEEFVLLESETGTQVLCAGKAYNAQISSVPGARYDSATNTLTLTNYTGPLLNVNMMGNSFTVRLEGENRLDGVLIWGFAYGGSVTFTGSGSLTVNQSLGRTYGIFLEGESSPSCVMVDRGVTLDVYGTEAALMARGITWEKGLYYLSPLRLIGGRRAAGDFTGSGNESAIDYTVVDETTGAPATHIQLTS